jgi:hypothetical protein
MEKVENPVMMNSQTRQRRSLGWMCAVAGVLACGLICYWGARTSYPLFAYDDAFISYRYAQNMRTGLGLVYNSGEWVLGTTTPLYTLILSVLGLLSSNIELMGHWLGVMSWMACVVGTMLYFWHEGSPRAGIIASLLIALQYLFLRALGMETTFVVALMILAAWAWLSKRKYLAVVLAALLLLSRFDTALWLLFLGFEVWRRQRRLPWREVVGVVILTLPWLAFAYWRYGAIMPNSASAKIGQNVFLQVNEVTQSFIEIFVAHITNSFSPIITLTIVFAVLCGLWVIIRHGHQHGWLLGWMLGYLAVYSSLKVSPFPWYFVPPLTALILICSLGIGHLLGDSGGLVSATEAKIGSSERQTIAAHNVKLLAGGVGILISLILIASSWSQIGDSVNVRGHPRWSEYYQTAQWFAENTNRNATVATIEIGIIGYYSNRVILDTMGLVSRDMAHHLTGWSDTLIYAITSHWPDYAVVLPKTAWDGIVTQWWFKEHYAPVASFGSAIGNLGPATIYAFTSPLDTNYSARAQANYVTGLALSHVDFDHQLVQPGEPLDLWLQFQIHRQQSSDYQLTVYLIDTQTGEHKALTTLWPYYITQAYPTSHWMSGDTRSVPVRLAIPEDLLPGTYRLGVLIYDPTRDRAIPLVSDPNSDYPEVQAGYLRVGQPPALAQTEDSTSISVEANWEGNVTLKTVSLPIKSPAAGDVLPLQLEWQATETPQRDAIVFVHLVDGNGNIVAQRDQRPFDNRFPMPAWRPGEVLHDTHPISLPLGLSSGTYSLRLGLYDSSGRLPRSDVTGNATSQDAVTIPIEIRSQGD